MLLKVRTAVQGQETYLQLTRIGGRASKRSSEICPCCSQSERVRRLALQRALGFGNGGLR